VNQGTKFAMGIILIMVATVLLYFAFHNIVSSDTIKTQGGPLAMLQSIQSVVGTGPGINPNDTPAPQGGTT
jgi:hypothetical protein